MAKKIKTALITTIQPIGGGVPQMVRFIAACLLQRGYQVRLAYYEPYSVSPELSVPLHRLWRLPFMFKKHSVPQIRVAEFEGMPAVGIGCWIPELEFTNYWCSSRWQSEIERCDFHLCVSGSNLAALPYWQMKLPFLAWVATPWLEDRQHRVKQFPWYRRCLDAILVRPVCQYIERRINQAGNIIALSDYTRNAVNQMPGVEIKNILPMPIDVKRFSPKKKSTKNNHETIKIGFVGRFEDPRKNIDLLLKAFAKSQLKHANLELVLVGDTASKRTKALLQQLNIVEKVTVTAYLPNDQLSVQLQSLSLFVIPSHQEGLCIAALEAMSCGVPVISTRCGGPENYLKNGKNGVLIDANPTALQQAILKIIEDTTLLNQYSKRARQTVVQQFSITAAEQRFWQFFAEVYPESINDSV